MNEEDEILLLANGWEVECESPFEIRYEDCEAFASGCAADIILWNMKYERDNAFSLYDMKECFAAGVNRGINIAAMLTKHDLGEEFPGYEEFMKKYNETE